jgi:hypothetical protein
VSNTGLTHAVWRKSSRSDSNGGACVETARLDGGGMAVRDSKDQAGPVLLFSSDEWSAFIGGVQLGEFDL